MTDPATLVALASVGTIGLCLTSAVALKGWQGWLELKRMELAGRSTASGPSPSPAARIELSDLKERVRRLEAIASGIEF